MFRRRSSRQELHEKIRLHSHAAAAQVKQHGKHNDLIERLKNDSAFGKVNFAAVMKPHNYVGRAPSRSMNSSQRWSPLSAKNIEQH